jgi:hypothetical protein
MNQALRNLRASETERQDAIARKQSIWGKHRKTKFKVKEAYLNAQRF